MPRGFLDSLVKIMGLVPYRCRSCSHRFYHRHRESRQQYRNQARDSIANVTGICDSL
jgi:hypothetical protein